MPETLYQLKDIAKIFGVSSSAVSNWRNRNTGPQLPEPQFVTSGGRPLFTRDQLAAIISEKTAAMNAVIQ